MKLAQDKKRNRISAEQSQKLAHRESTRERKTKMKSRRKIEFLTNLK